MVARGEPVLKSTCGGVNVIATGMMYPLKKSDFPLAIAMFGVVLMAPLYSYAESPTASPALAVSFAMPAERQWPETVPASGWLKPWQEAVIASETSGLRITDVLADVGSVVEKGEVLVRLAPEAVAADLRKQVAAVEVAKANLSKATADADRARQLRSSGALSNEKIVEYLATEQTATANLEQEEAVLESTKIKFAQTTITAVDDGLITSRSAELGAVVTTGTELFRLVRQQRVEWQAEVSARYLSRISEGLRAEIDGLSDKAVQGHVRLAGPSVNTGTGRAIIYVTLPNDIQPRTGLYVTGNIQLETTPALTVPDTAIVYRDGTSYVFVVGQDARVRRVRVETGRRRAGEVEVVSGIEANARIVTSGGTFLSDNDLVKVTGQSL